MSEQNQNTLIKLNQLDVYIVNTAQEGYRRAGFALKAGENILSNISAEQFDMLSSDPRLVVSVIAEPDSIEPGRMADGLLSGVTRAELLATAAAQARRSEETDPLKFFTKSGGPRIDAWRAIVGPDLTLDEIKTELERTAD